LRFTLWPPRKHPRTILHRVGDHEPIPCYPSRKLTRRLTLLAMTPALAVAEPEAMGPPPPNPLRTKYGFHAYAVRQLSVESVSISTSRPHPYMSNGGRGKSLSQSVSGQRSPVSKRAFSEISQGSGSGPRRSFGATNGHPAHNFPIPHALQVTGIFPGSALVPGIKEGVRPQLSSTWTAEREL